MVQITAIQKPTAQEIVSALEACSPIANDLSYVETEARKALMSQITEYVQNYFLDSNWAQQFVQNQKKSGIEYRKENFIAHACKSMSYAIEQMLTNELGMNERLAAYYKEGGGFLSNMFGAKQVSKCPNEAFDLSDLPESVSDEAAITCLYTRQIFDLFKATQAQKECKWPSILSFVGNSDRVSDFAQVLHFTFSLERTSPNLMPPGSVTKTGQLVPLQIGPEIVDDLCQKQSQREICEYKDWTAAFAVGSETLFPPKLSESFEHAVKSARISKPYFLSTRLSAKQEPILANAWRYDDLKREGERDLIKLGHAQVDAFDAKKAMSKQGGIFDADRIATEMKEAGVKVHEIHWDEVKDMSPEEQNKYLQSIIDEIAAQRDKKGQK